MSHLVSGWVSLFTVAALSDSTWLYVLEVWCIFTQGNGSECVCTAALKAKGNQISITLIFMLHASWNNIGPGQWASFINLWNLFHRRKKNLVMYCFFFTMLISFIPCQSFLKLQECLCHIYISYDQNVP